MIGSPYSQSLILLNPFSFGCILVLWDITFKKIILCFPNIYCVVEGEWNVVTDQVKPRWNVSDLMRLPRRPYCSLSRIRPTNRLPGRLLSLDESIILSSYYLCKIWIVEKLMFSNNEEIRFNPYLNKIKVLCADSSHTSFSPLDRVNSKMFVGASIPNRQQ